MENKVLDATGFDAWQARYDADVAACEAAGDYPFAGYTDLQQQVFFICREVIQCKMMLMQII